MDRRTREPLPDDGARIDLGAIRACLEGAIPAMMATCAADGTPNVAYISQVYYVDERHVALSFQFFNKTRANILANPFAAVLVMDPVTAGIHRLSLRYLRTETGGALFEGMKAQLAGIASYSGMAGVFRLLGADVYEVLALECVSPAALVAPPARQGLLAALRCSAERLACCSTLDDLLQTALGALTGPLGAQHAMVLLVDAQGQRLYTVASAGYASSGIGSEIEMGHGVIGVAARERTPVRISHMTHAASYSHAVRASMLEIEPGLTLETDIPFPGLAAPHSQLAVPVVSSARVLGVLFVESLQDLRFGFEDEDLLVALAGQIGATLELLQLQSAAEPAEATAPAPAPAPEPAGPPLRMRHYGANDSVFIDEHYLIKGVAGAIFWKLLREFTGSGRSEFTNRELRLDPALGLPDVADNLETRLVLLQRRLQENSPHVYIEKTGRGRFRLCVHRPLHLVEIGA